MTGGDVGCDTSVFPGLDFSIRIAIRAFAVDIEGLLVSCP